MIRLLPRTRRHWSSQTVTALIANACLWMGEPMCMAAGRQGLGLWGIDKPGDV